MSASISFQHHQTARRELSRLLRMLAGFLLGFALAAWVCFANAALSGYQFDSRCLLSQEEVIEAFKMRSQYLGIGNDYEVCGGAYAPVMVANLSYTGQTAPLAIKYYKSAGGPQGDQCTTSTANYLGVPTCDPDVQSLAFTGTNALFLVLGYFYAAMLGFKTGYRA